MFRRVDHIVFILYYRELNIYILFFFIFFVCVTEINRCHCVVGSIRFQEFEMDRSLLINL